MASGDPEAARAHLREAITLYERIGDERRAASLRRLGEAPHGSYERISHSHVAAG